MSGRDWDRVAQTQPYWGVLSHDRFLADRLDDPATAEFWASGEEHVARVFAVLHERVSAEFRPDVAVDFGCGVGRLLYPIALRAERVIGVDASPTMLAIAQDNLAERGVENCQLVQSLPGLRAAVGSYDFLHSALVFQHIRPSEGYAVFRQLLTGLASGGCGAVHFKVRASWQLGQIIRSTRARSHILGRLAAKLRGAPRQAALIEVHGYDLGRLLMILEQAGIPDVLASTSVADGLDITLFFRKP